MNQDTITIDPAIMIGQPCIRGTRLTVKFVLQQLANGLTRDELIREYPTLTKDGIAAALKYAAEQMPSPATEAA